MTALIRYQLADLLASQRWVAPLLAYLAFVGFVYASDAGPAVPAFGVTSLALLPVSAWLTRQLLSVEDDAARQVTAAAAGGLGRVQTALACAALVAQLPLVLAAVTWAFVANHPNLHGTGAVAGGLILHLVFACAGVGLGAVVARPVLRPPGTAALLIVTAFVVGLIVPWSPLLEAARAVQTNPVHHFRAGLFPWLACLFGLGLLGAGVSVLVAARE